MRSAHSAAKSEAEIEILSRQDAKVSECLGFISYRIHIFSSK